MNIAIFTTAAALLLGLSKRKEENKQDRDIKKPQHPVIRDRVVSIYPLSFSSFNDVLGAFPLACSRVFPQSKFMNYSLFPTNIPGQNNFSETEIKTKFPMAMLLSDEDLYVANRSNLTFYKLNLKDKKTQWKASTKNYKINPTTKENLSTFLQMFEWAKSQDVIIEVNYSRSEAKGDTGFQKDQEKINSIIKMLKDSSPKLNKLTLYTNLIDACPYSGQRDIRLFITTFPLNERIKTTNIDSFVVNLDPISRIQKSLVLPQMDANRRSEHSPIGKTYDYKQTDIYKVFYDKKGNLVSERGNFSKTGDFSDPSVRYPEKCAKRMQVNPIWRPYLLEDWRLNTKYPILRYFSLGELERLAGFPTGWINERKNQNRGRALHISSNPLILEYILQCYCLHYFDRFKPGVYYA
jgi:hypothetical protein